MTPEHTHLFGFTVQGIQSYIFQTNNLKEIIGASEIVEAVCTNWFDAFNEKNSITGTTIQQAAGNIKFFTTEDNAKKLFLEFGLYINQKAPGLPFSMAVVEGLKLDELNTKLSAQRNQPLYSYDLGQMGRLLARTTGDAAVVNNADEKDSYKEKRPSIDLSNYKKFKNSKSADSSLLHKINIESKKLLSDDFDKMAADGKHSWLALIHIDGNGMGNRITEINSSSKGPLEKSTEISKFASNIAECTNGAFKVAYELTFSKFNEGDKIPFRPLILGGDDVTVMLRADYAMAFVQIFLTNYQKLTKENPALGKEFTACAGVAFVKAKFPFHYSADLAEELCSYAKEKSGRDKSCVLFHKVSDSFITDYEELIKKELITPKKNDDKLCKELTTPKKNGDKLSKELTLPQTNDDNLCKELTTPQTNGVKLCKDFYTLTELKNLLIAVETLRQNKNQANVIRQWVDLKMNRSPEASLIEHKLPEKLKKESYADYLTLLAVS